MSLVTRIKIFGKLTVISMLVLFLFLIGTAKGASISISNIGVSTLVNGEELSYDKKNGNHEDISKTGIINKDVLTVDKYLRTGVAYPFEFAVGNPGVIDIYSRVTQYLYFIDYSDNVFKKRDLLSRNQLMFFTSPDNTADWIRYIDSSTQEREVYYYRWKIENTNVNFDTIHKSKQLFDCIKLDNQKVQALLSVRLLLYIRKIEMCF